MNILQFPGTKTPAESLHEIAEQGTQGFALAAIKPDGMIFFAVAGLSHPEVVYLLEMFKHHLMSDSLEEI